MRTLKQFFISVLFFSSFIISCNKEDKGDYVKPITLYEHVAGDWSLSSIKQIDLTAKAASIKPDEVQLTNALTFNTMKLSLKADADNNPTTFAVTGTAPALFPTSGFWALNSNFQNTDGTPVKVLLYSDAAKTQSVGQLTMQAAPGAVVELELVLNRTAKGVAYVAYDYKFVAATN